MNSLILPLVVSLAAVGAHNGDYRPAAEPVGPWVDVRAMDRPVPEAFQVTTPGLDAALAASPYPESLRFAESTIDTQQASLGTQSVVVTDGSRLQSDWLTSRGEPEDEFDITRGGGLVGIGFRWRFR